RSHSKTTASSRWCGRKSEALMLKLNRSLVNVSRQQRDAWAQRHSARREQLLAHVPQQQRAGHLSTPATRPGGAVAKIPGAGGGERPATSFLDPEGCGCSVLPHAGKAGNLQNKSMDYTSPMSGPPPIPTRLKVLRGNPGKQKLSVDVLQ